MMIYKWISNGVRFSKAHEYSRVAALADYVILSSVSGDDIISAIIENGLVGLVNVTPMRRSFVISGVLDESRKAFCRKR